MAAVKSTRGEFIALQAGYQHGNGRPHPMPCGANDPICVKDFLKKVTSDKDFDELAGYISSAYVTLTAMLL